MKKKEIYEGIVEDILFPNKGIVRVDGFDGKVVVKGVIPGEKISFRVSKIKNHMAEGTLVDILEKSPDEIESLCPHYSVCGGCSYQNLSYENQIELKNRQLIGIFKKTISEELRKNPSLMKEGESADEYFDSIYEGCYKSPIFSEYRNKMEFSFGDSSKGGELELGLHKKGSFYDIVSVKDCRIVDCDFRMILTETLSYFRGKGCTYFHKMTHEGFLRHLLIRKAAKTEEILVCLVTSSQLPQNTICCEKGIIEDWLEMICSLNYKGKLKGVLHIINDSLSDVVKSDETRILYGRDYIYEELLGLRFKISPFSFFQTNSLSAEVIYNTVREYVGTSLGEKKDKIVFDLYSGTGTIAQLIAPVAGEVIGIEIVEEAVIAARENAELNKLNNCKFKADDVLKALDNVTEKPDFIILDPPRDGVHPKALRKIIDYGVENLIYIACKPTSLARDLEMLMGCGYKPIRLRGVDQFPGTVHVETVVLMSRDKE